jgi:hypothetical protein
VSPEVELKIILVINLQLLNAPFLIVTTESGILILVKEQSLKDSEPIVTTEIPIVTLVSDVQPLKASVPTEVTKLPIITEGKLVLFLNALSPMEVTEKVFTPLLILVGIVILVEVFVTFIALAVEKFSSNK